MVGHGGRVGHVELRLGLGDHEVAVRAAVDLEAAGLRFPLFVKPRWEGSAKGIRKSSRVEDRAALVRLGVAVACAMNLMFLHGALYAGEHSGMASPFESFFRWVSLGLSMPVIVFSARPFFQAAWSGLRARIEEYVAVEVDDGSDGPRDRFAPDVRVIER